MKHSSIEINNMVAKKMEIGEKEVVSPALCDDALSTVKDLMIYNKELSKLEICSSELVHNK